MKKGIIAIVVVMLVVLISTPLTMAETAIQAPKTDTWDGSADTSWYEAGQSEFTISTAEELAGLAELTNSGNSFQGIEIKLDAHIDLGGKEWMPIGANSFSGPFRGGFDGRGYTISNFTINRSGNTSVGFFGLVYGGTGIRNLGILNADVFGASNVGGLVGSLYSDGSGTTSAYNCYVTGKVESAESSASIAGGLVGIAKVPILYSFSTADVTAGSTVGGLVGSAQDSEISYCYAMGDVSLTGPTQNYAGGLVGDAARGNITGSFATGNVIGKEASSGLAGGRIDSGITIKSSYATGTVQGETQAGLTTIDKTKCNIINSYGNSDVNVVGVGTNGSEYVLGTPGATVAQIKDAAFLAQLNSIPLAEDFPFGLDSNFNDGFPYVAGIMQVMAGNGQIAMQGETVVFKITSNYVPGKTRILIDDKEVPLNFYEMKSGSTIITLLGDYTDALEAGSHEIRFVTDENIAGIVGYFGITDAPEEDIDAPITGDNFSLYILVATAILSIAGSISIITRKKI